MQEKAEQREAALGKAESMLEEDVKRFDVFLRENAEKLQEAVSHAETQTKSKQEKVSFRDHSLLGSASLNFK